MIGLISILPTRLIFFIHDKFRLNNMFMFNVQELGILRGLRERIKHWTDESYIKGRDNHLKNASSWPVISNWLTCKQTPQDKYNHEH
jgi:hypothetical protein